MVGLIDDNVKHNVGEPNQDAGHLAKLGTEGQLRVTTERENIEERKRVRGF